MSDVEFRNDVDVELVEYPASDLRVAKAAWVSTKGARAEDEQDESRIGGLIKFLVRDRHGSPFEHNSFTFAIRCPIFVIREFHRHRVGWSYNEESGRYTQLKPQFYIIGDDRKTVQTGKPGHYVFGKGTRVQTRMIQRLMMIYSSAAYKGYQYMLKKGVAKEVARMILPLNIYSSFYATCNARSLMHFLSLRTESDHATIPSHPQHEIQMVADKMEELFEVSMPLTYRAWNENGRMPV